MNDLPLDHSNRMLHLWIGEVLEVQVQGRVVHGRQGIAQLMGEDREEFVLPTTLLDERVLGFLERSERSEDLIGRGRELSQAAKEAIVFLVELASPVVRDHPDGSDRFPRDMERDQEHFLDPGCDFGREREVPLGA